MENTNKESNVASGDNQRSALNISGDMNPKTVEKIAWYQLIFSIASLIFALFSVIGGIFLFFKGISGSTNWVTESIGFKSNLTNAAPGVVLFVVGLLVIFLTRFKMNIKR